MVSLPFVPKIVAMSSLPVEDQKSDQTMRSPNFTAVIGHLFKDNLIDNYKIV
jgi:hypothetical protein